MAKEHHCPNCGPMPCNSATSKVHTCPKCGRRWEEDLARPAEPKPA